jgi:hypothetical protein
MRKYGDDVEFFLDSVCHFPLFPSSVFCLFLYFDKYPIPPILLLHIWEPLLWSSGQSSWLVTQRSRVRLQSLPDFLSSSGSGTGSTQLL